jgi:hypothetical protein
MPRGAAKTIKKAVLDPSRLDLDKAAIDLTIEEITDGFKDLKPLQLKEINAETPPTPYYDVDESVVWKDAVPKGKMLEATIRQVCALFNLKSEISSWTVRYYPPPTTIDKKKSIIIPRADMSTIARAVIVIGSGEVINMFSKVGGTMVQSKLETYNRRCYFLKFGVCSGIGMSMTNGEYDEIPPKSGGHRKKVIRKQVLQRHVFVLDGRGNADVISSMWKKKEDSAAEVMGAGIAVPEDPLTVARKMAEKKRLAAAVAVTADADEEDAELDGGVGAPVPVPVEEHWHSSDMHQVVGHAVRDVSHSTLPIDGTDGTGSTPL